MKDVTRGHLDKAARAVRAATLLLEDGHADFAASRASFALLYTTAALLGEEDLRVAEQLDLHGQLRERFARTRSLDVSFARQVADGVALRLRADYDSAAAISPEAARAALAEARAFVASAEAYLATREATARAA